MNLVDTNVLVDYPAIIKKRTDLVIPLFIVEELDSLKRMENRELSKRARKASRMIKDYKDNITFDVATLDSIYASYADDGLVKLAKMRGYGVITNDINLELKCEISHIPYQEYYEENDNYTGILRLYETREEDLPFIAKLYENDIENFIEGKDENLTIYQNEYIIIYGENNQVKDLLKVYKNRIISIYSSSLDYIINSDSLDKPIHSRNIEQQCLMDALYSNSTIVCALGPFGSGKSFLCANYAIQQLEKGKIDKIVYIPNNSQVEATEELAALPGELFEKMLPHMGTLVDIMGKELLEECCMNGTIEILPVSVARGRNLENSIIFVNEAQNLTEEHIKLLIGRVSENSRIFFDGDIKQSDRRIFKERNGLRLLLKLKDSPRYNKLFSVVKMVKTERSETAMAAQYLDEVQE